MPAKYCRWCRSKHHYTKSPKNHNSNMADTGNRSTSINGGGSMNTRAFSGMMTNPPDMNVRTELSDFMQFIDTLKAGTPMTRSGNNGANGQHLHSVALAELVKSQVGVFPTLVMYRTFFGNDRFLSTVCAPLSLSESLTYRGVVKEYEPGMPQKTSERGPLRSGRWTESEFSMTLEYYGIGLRMTYQQMQTNTGAEMLNMARNRMVDSFLDMFNASVLRAYLGCNDAAFDQEVRDGQDSWNDPALAKAQDRERLFFDMVHREDFSMNKLSDEISKQQKKYGGTGNVLIVHPDIKPAIKYRAVNTMFWMGGNEAVQNVKTPADQTLTEIDGVAIYTVPDKSAYNSDLCQLLVNRAIYGQYYQMKPRWEQCSGSDLADCDLWSTIIYNADIDQGEAVGLDYALDACGLWDALTGQLVDINALANDGRFDDTDRFVSTHYLDTISNRYVPASYYGQLAPEYFRTTTLLKFAQRVSGKVLKAFGDKSAAEVTQHMGVLEEAVRTIERIRIDDNVAAFVGASVRDGTAAAVFAGLQPPAGLRSAAANEFGGITIPNPAQVGQAARRVWQLPPLMGNYAGLRTIGQYASADKDGFSAAGWNYDKAKDLSKALDTFDTLASLLDNYLPGNFLTSQRYASSWWQNATDAHTLFENTLGNNRAPVFVRLGGAAAAADTRPFNEVFESLVAVGDTAARQVQATITGALERVPGANRIGAEFMDGAEVAGSSVVFTNATLPALARPAFVGDMPAKYTVSAARPAVGTPAEMLRKQIDRIVGIMFNYRYIPTAALDGTNIEHKLKSEHQRAIALTFISHVQLVQSNEPAAVQENAQKLKLVLDWLVAQDGASTFATRSLAQAADISTPQSNNVPLQPLPSTAELRASMKGAQVQVGNKNTAVVTIVYGPGSGQIPAALNQIDAVYARTSVALREAMASESMDTAYASAADRNNLVRAPLTYAPAQLANWTTTSLVPASIDMPDMPMSQAQIGGIRDQLRRNTLSRLSAADNLHAVAHTARWNLATGVESAHSELARRVLAAAEAHVDDEQSMLATSIKPNVSSASLALDPAVSTVLRSRGFVERYNELQRISKQNTLERIIALTYMATPTSRDTALALASAKIGVPFSFLLFQPRVRLTTVDAIKVQTGAETAEQKMAYPLSFYGQESQTQEFSAGLKLWHGVIVKQPINVYRVRNFMITGYQGGFNLRPFRFEEWRPTVSHMDGSGCSIFVVAEPIDGAKYSPRISIYGKHEDSLPGYVAQPGRNVALHYHNAALANGMWQFRQLRGPGSLLGSDEPLAYCWRGPSYPINVMSGKYDQIVTSMGYLSTAAQTHGLIKVWSGESVEYPKIDISTFTPVN